MKKDVIEFIEESKKKQFGWGSFDCFMFTERAMKRLHGQSFFEDFWFSYKTPRGALSRMKEEYGVEDMVSLYEKAYGDRVPPNNLQAGDIVMAKSNTDLFPLASGVFDGTFGWFTTDDGLVAVRRNEVEFGFRYAPDTL